MNTKHIEAFISGSALEHFRITHLVRETAINAYLPGLELSELVPQIELLSSLATRLDCAGGLPVSEENLRCYVQTLDELGRQAALLAGQIPQALASPRLSPWRGSDSTAKGTSNPSGHCQTEQA